MSPPLPTAPAGAPPRQPTPRKGNGFDAFAVEAARSHPIKLALSQITVSRDRARIEALNLLPDTDALRSLAADIRRHTLDHLDHYLEQFEASFRARGGIVHLARDAADARKIAGKIAKAAGCKSCIKAKSAASDEADLTAALTRVGVVVINTYPGEVASVTTPRSKRVPKPSDAQTVAPDLRAAYRRADLGVTGANFLIAETGQVCVVEDAGNARHSLTTPRVLITIAGIEKLVPRLADLAVMLKLLTRHATGETLTAYTTLFGGPRGAAERDGPEQHHVILLDNGRSDILAGPYREALQCIRCGACANTCPVYRTVGPSAYGAVYTGPIGAVLTPLMLGLSKFRDLPQASTLCGACRDACPVKIDIPRHLINLRRDIVRREITRTKTRAFYRLWAWAMSSEMLYNLTTRYLSAKLRRRARGTGWVDNVPRPAQSWSAGRPLPAPPAKSFRALWSERKP